MKKLIALLLSVLMVACLFTGCSKKAEEPKAEAPAAAEAPKAEEPKKEEPKAEEPKAEEPKQEEPKAEEVKAMSYAEYMAAPVETEVVIEASVQNIVYNAKYGNANMFLQDEEGGYYVYRMACTDEDAAKLVPGATIRVKGFKGEWAGEVEIAEGTATYELLDGTYVAEAVDVTDKLGTDAINAYQNMLVAFSGMKVAPSADPEGKEVAFLYNWDGSGSHDENSDLYFNVTVGGEVYNFCVESDECPNDSEVYAAVENLKVGDRIDMKGFLYWYNGANPHICEVSKVMTHDEYIAAPVDTEVTLVAYVQMTAYAQAYGNINMYLADEDGGAYYVYRMACTDEDAAKLVPGAKVRVTGFKGEWAGEMEIAEGTASYELLPGSYIAEPRDIYELLDQDQNTFFFAKDVEVLASTDPDGKEVAFLYSWDGSGTREGNSDLYVNLGFPYEGEIIPFAGCVESDECSNETEVYAAVENLKVGDKIDIEGFLYWYNGPQPHLTKVTVK